MVSFSRWFAVILTGLFCFSYSVCPSAEGDDHEESFFEESGAPTKRRKKKKRDLRQELVCLHEERMHDNNRAIKQRTKDVTIKNYIEENEESLDAIRKIAEDELTYSQLEAEIKKLKKDLKG